jgi:hypothetical protein
MNCRGSRINGMSYLVNFSVIGELVRLACEGKRIGSQTRERAPIASLAG